MADKNTLIIIDQTGENADTEQMASGGSSPIASKSTAPKTQKAAQPKTKSKGIGMTAIATGLILSVAKQGANLVLSSVGMITGDTLKQNRVNTALKGAGYIAAFATLNPVVIGGALVSIGMEATTYAVNEGHRVKWENIQIQEDTVYKNLLTAGNGRKRL